MNVLTFGRDTWTHKQKACITVGTFDGVHRGHQGVISLMRKVADAEGLRVVVVTFDPHPQIVLSRPGREPLGLLTTIDERCERLAQVGVDDVVIIPFTLEFAQTPADAFIKQLTAMIDVQHFFIGHDMPLERVVAVMKSCCCILAKNLVLQLNAYHPCRQVSSSLAARWCAPH